MTSGYGFRSVEIVKLIMQETGTYNQQYRRSFESNLTSQVQKNIIENCEKAGRITTGLITGLANQFIKPRAAPERPIDIVNGWGSRRFRFFMEVRSSSYMGIVLVQYVTGYTDHMGVSYGGGIDPNMRFYINTVNTTKSSIRNTPTGATNVQSVMDCSHLLYANEYNGVFGNNTQHKMRPEDVFETMQDVDLRCNLDSESMAMDWRDARSHLTTKAVKAARRYNSSPVYVASILDSYVQTKRSDISGSSDVEIYDNASAQVASSRINEDPFITMLINHTDTGTGGWFKFSELMRIDKDIASKIIMAPLTPALRATLHQTGNSNGWESSDYETQFATTLSQAVPGYMLDNCLQSVKFRATNDHMSTIMVHLIDYGTLLQGIDPRPYLGAFSYAIEKTLLQDLTFNNQINFTLEMSCNLIGDTFINLSINGSPMIPYVAPCYCDSLMSPLITADLTNLNALATDINNVIDYLGDATGSASSNFIDKDNMSFI